MDNLEQEIFTNEKNVVFEYYTDKKYTLEVPVHYIVPGFYIMN